MYIIVNNTWKKHDVIEVSKNFARYSSKNNFVILSK